jgi:hypothetical protein
VNSTHRRNTPTERRCDAKAEKKEALGFSGSTAHEIARAADSRSARAQTTLLGGDPARVVD